MPGVEVRFICRNLHQIQNLHSVLRCICEESSSMPGVEVRGCCRF